MRSVPPISVALLRRIFDTPEERRLRVIERARRAQDPDPPARLVGGRLTREEE